MIASVKGQPVELLINTVSIAPEQDGNALYMFHCINCGSNIQKYQGRIAKITPVLEPYDMVFTYPQCRKCGAYYAFQAYKSKPVIRTQVTLYTQPMGKSLFYCYEGRGEPMLIYTHQGIYSTVESKLMMTPFESTCNNPMCHELYTFADIV